jgi:hypothetical protein
MKKENRMFVLLSIAAIMFLSLLTTTQQVQAQTFSGQAVGVQLRTTSQTSVVGSTVNVLAETRLADTGPLPPSGGTRSAQLLEAQVIATGVVNSTFTTGVLTSTTMGGLDNGVPRSSSQATVNDVNLVIGGNTITATQVQANSQCTCSGDTPTCSGDTILTNLTINGTLVNGQVIARPAPNTTLLDVTAMATALNVTTTTTTTIIANQQMTGMNADGSTFITVNALRITTTSSAFDSATGITTTTTTDIIIAQANSDINCTAQAVPPTAATAMITGRVTVNTGFTRGTGTLFVTILNTRTLATQVSSVNRLGYYQFNDLPTGDTYVLTVRGKGYTFTPQTISLAEDSALDMSGTAVGRSGSKGSKRDF